MALAAIPSDKLAAALRDGEDASGAELFALIATKDAKIRESLAARQDAPMSVLIHLAQDPKGKVREALAANPAMARVQSVVEMLAVDRDADVVLALANNTAVPLAWISELGNHPKRKIREAIEARA